MAGHPLGQVLKPHVLWVILCHWVLAISLIFVNKQLLTDQDADQDLTIFIAWAQCFFSVLAVFLVVFMRRCFNPRSPGIDIPLVTFMNSDVLYMTFTFIGIIILNNLLLKDIGVDFYQIARSTTLIFTVVFTRILLGVKVSVRVLFSCTLIILGFLVSVDQEMLVSSLSWVSVCYGLFASMSAAMNGIFIKRADKQVRGNALNLSLVNNINTVIILFPLLISSGQLQSALNSSHAMSLTAWAQLVVTGVLRLLVGWTAVKVISLTSPVTHHMSINAKSLLQTIIAVVVQGELKTVIWWVGNFLVVMGIVNYGLSKSQRSEKLVALGSGVSAVRKTFVASRSNSVLSV